MRVSASSVPSATALPCMSSCMSSMPRNGFRLFPPVSKQIPLPTSATGAPPFGAFGGR